jgi:hypothetical protein
MTIEPNLSCIIYGLPVAGWQDQQAGHMVQAGGSGMSSKRRKGEGVQRLGAQKGK